MHPECIPKGDGEKKLHKHKFCLAKLANPYAGPYTEKQMAQLMKFAERRRH